MREYSLTETAGLVRQALKASFPKTKFSVRSKRYAGGCSIDVDWTDGPTTSQVKPILDAFEGSGFDGMQDLKYHHPPSELNGEPCEFNVDFVQGQRSESAENIKAAAFKTAFECDLPLLKLGTHGLEGGEARVPWSKFERDGEIKFAFDSSNQGGEWYSQLVYQVARATSFEATQPTTLPRMVTERYIAEVVEGMVA